MGTGQFVGSICSRDSINEICVYIYNGAPWLRNFGKSIDTRKFDYDVMYVRLKSQFQVETYAHASTRAISSF